MNLSGIIKDESLRKRIKETLLTSMICDLGANATIECIKEGIRNSPNPADADRTYQSICDEYDRLTVKQYKAVLAPTASDAFG